MSEASELPNQIIVPKGWCLRELGDLFEFKNGVNAGKESYGIGTKFINVMEIIYNEMITPDMIKGSVQITNEQIKLYAVKDGDIIFNRTSETTNEIGLSSVYFGDEDVVFGGFVIRATSLNNDLNRFFKKYCFRSNLVRNQIIKGGQGVVRSNIGQGDLSKIKLLVPPYNEQQKIAKFLGSIDDTINITTKLISKKEKNKKWLMQQLLTGKKRLKGFEGEWQSFTYDTLLKVVRRPIKWNENELYNLISVRRRSGGIFLRDALLGSQILVKDLRSVEKGDFLFSKMQILHGASALVTDEYSKAKVSGSYIVVVPKDLEILNMEFFNWYSKLPYFYHQTYISSYGVHIEKMTFDFNTFLDLKITLPAYTEQVAINNILETADKEIKLLKEKIEKLKEQKKGLMQVLLTGKKRLK